MQPTTQSKRPTSALAATMGPRERRRLMQSGVAVATPETASAHKSIKDIEARLVASGMVLPPRRTKENAAALAKLLEPNEPPEVLTEKAIRSLLELILLGDDRGATAAAALRSLLITAGPDRAEKCRQLVECHGISVVHALLRSPYPKCQMDAASILTMICDAGFTSKVQENQGWIYNAKMMLKSEHLPCKASAAMLVSMLRPGVTGHDILPEILTCIKLSSESVRVEGARALETLCGDITVCQKLVDGSTIQLLLDQVQFNGTLSVRDSCAHVLSRAAATSTKHRIKIVGNGGIPIFFDSLVTSDRPKTICSSIEVLLSLLLEERWKMSIINQGLHTKLYTIAGAFDKVYRPAKIRNFAAHRLQELNELVSVVEDVRGVGAMNSAQDTDGIANLFTWFPVLFVCKVLRRVCRAWRKASYLPKSWQTLDFAHSTRLRLRHLNTFLSKISLDFTVQVNLSGCGYLGAEAFDVFSSAITCPLEFMDLSDCVHVTDDAVVRIVKFSEGALKTIILSGCNNLSNKSVVAMTWILDEVLQTLIIDRCSWVQDEAVILLSGACRALTRLGIAGCENLTDSGRVALSYFKVLEQLDLSMTEALNDATLGNLVETLTHLSSLELAGCDCISNDGMAVLTKLNNLRVLDLSGIMLLSDETCSSIVSANTGLMCLKLMMVPAVSYGVAHSLATRCQGLVELDLSFNTLLSDEALTLLVRRCSVLTSLSIAWCELLSADSFMAIAECCGHLSYLNISQCEVQNSQLAAIAGQCEHLREIVVVSCPRLTAAGLRECLKLGSRYALCKLDARCTADDAWYHDEYKTIVVKYGEIKRSKPAQETSLSMEAALLVHRSSRLMLAKKKR